MNSLPRRALFVLVTLFAGLLATGCGAASDASDTPPVSAPLTITDPWVKAVDTGMTAAFGTLVNHSDKPITIVSATSPTSLMELHEMVMKDGKMIMQPKKGGFTIPARGSHELSPGGDHLMFMDVKAPVKAGDEVSVTLKLADGTSVPFTAVGKPFAGAEESYAPGTGA